MKIEIKNLTKIYPRGKKKALNGVNIEIGQGIFGLIGRNGAGKTTLMRIVATIMDATDGEIYFDGKELKANKDEFRSSLGYLPQSTKLMPRMNIVEFLDYVCILKGIKNKEERKTRIASAIETVGLVGEEKKRLGKYSGGMLRRAGIAQALIGDPKVLIIDEPTTGLDPEERLYFLNLLSKIAMERTMTTSRARERIFFMIGFLSEKIFLFACEELVTETNSSYSRYYYITNMFSHQRCKLTKKYVANC